jgi:hypothetical protein
MLDANTIMLVNIALAFGAAAFWALPLFVFARRRRVQPDLAYPADTWSMEKFGIWWIARALVILMIFVVGVGFTFLGPSRNVIGTIILFGFSGVHVFAGFIRGKM